MQQDPMLAMLARMAGGGWKDLEGLQAGFDDATRQVTDAEQAELDRQAALVARVFATPDGQDLLTLLLCKTLLRPPAEDERAAQTAEAYAIARARREGQDSVVFDLLGLIQRASGKPQNGGQS